MRGSCDGTMRASDWAMDLHFARRVASAFYVLSLAGCGDAPTADEAEQGVIVARDGKRVDESSPTAATSAKNIDHF
jgi:hypothetical protein